MFGQASTKSKLIINALLLTFVAVLYGGLWYGTSHVSGVIASEQAKLAETENAVIRIDQIKKFLAETEGERVAINEIVIFDADVVGFIESFEALAVDIGLEQKTEAVSDAVYPGLDAKKWGALQIVMSVKGSWAEVYQFLSLIEHTPHRTDVLSAVIEKEAILEEGGTTTENWRGEFTIRVLKHK